MKRGDLTIVFVIVILLIIPIASANIFSDFWGQITGKATQDTTALNITIGNAAPTIPWIELITAKNPTDDTTTSIVFNFTARDTDGYGNINVDSENASFMRAGEEIRTNISCINWANSGNDANFTCTIDMWYFDENGAWTINVSIKDINNAYAENSSTTFTYNVLPAMKMFPTSLNWPEIGLTSTDTGSNNDPLRINNTGNDVGLTINVTSYNLRGEETTTEFIYANNFTIGIATEGCAGTTMANATSTEIGSAILNRGNHSINDGSTGQEDIFFCLKGVPQDISAQSYSSVAYGPWTIAIVS